MLKSWLDSGLIKSTKNWNNWNIDVNINNIVINASLFTLQLVDNNIKH